MKTRQPSGVTSGDWFKFQVASSNLLKFLHAQIFTVPIRCGFRHHNQDFVCVCVYIYMCVCSFLFPLINKLEHHYEKKLNFT
jgi:hypothetical protein